MTDTDLVSCEACGSDADVEACTSMSEGGWLCPKCQADAAADFKSCKHEWVADNRDGDDGWHCMRCSHFVAADSFKGLFGCDSPEEFDQ